MPRRKKSAEPSLFDEGSAAPVTDRDFIEEMEVAYLEYSMSVIVARALPDVRDGLKPVQRRILWGMQTSGVRADGPRRKSAKVVGEVMGSYHPHGDKAIYDALVRMAQPFSTYVPLVDGQGNFGSPGFPPAAMRYTECRMTPTAAAMLADIDEDTVDFAPTYDGSGTEPTVLPAAFPNLLVNGASGIAVGMATSIPTHNPLEVVDATLVALDDPAATPRKLMRKVKGPDFPSGCDILDAGGDKGLAAAYATGDGKVTCRATVTTSDAGRGATLIEFRNLPPATATGQIAEQIVEQYRKGKLQSVSDVQDASAKGEQVLHVTVKRGHSVPGTVAELFRLTRLEDTFSLNMRALVDGVPRVLSLPEILHAFCAHRMEVVERRSRFRRAKAEARRHIVRALIAALDVIDEVIALIRAAENTNAASEGLQALLDIDAEQAKAILDMPLRRLTALEVQALRDELVELDGVIKALTRIITQEDVRRGVVRDELTELRKSVAGTKRRSRIVSVEDAEEESAAEAEAEAEALAETLATAVQVRVLRSGVIEVTPPESRRRSWKGGDSNLAPVADLDLPLGGRLGVVTDDGRAWTVPLADVPQGRRVPLGDVCDAPRGAAVLLAFEVPDGETSTTLLVATSDAKTKRLEVADVVASRRDGLSIVKLDDDARLVGATFVADDDHAVYVSSDGHALRIAVGDVPVQGRAAAGVKAMRCDADAVVVAAAAAPEDKALVVGTSGGWVKAVALSDLSVQGRGGKGLTVSAVGKARGVVTSGCVTDRRRTVFAVDDANKTHETSANPAGRTAGGKHLAGSVAALFV